MHRHLRIRRGRFDGILDQFMTLVLRQLCELNEHVSERRFVRLRVRRIGTRRSSSILTLKRSSSLLNTKNSLENASGLDLISGPITLI